MSIVLFPDNVFNTLPDPIYIPFSQLLICETNIVKACFGMCGVLNARSHLQDVNANILAVYSK